MGKKINKNSAATYTTNAESIKNIEPAQVNKYPHTSHTDRRVGKSVNARALDPACHHDAEIPSASHGKQNIHTESQVGVNAWPLRVPSRQ